MATGEEVAAFGGSRSGKTFCIVRAIVIRALKCPYSRHAIVRKEKTAAVNNIMKKTFVDVMRISMPGVYYREDKTNKAIIFANGSVIKFCGLDGNNADRVLGDEFDSIFIDELTEIRELATYELLLSRLNAINCKKKLLAVAFNPKSKKSWQYKRFIKGLNQKGEKLKNKPRHIIINPADNECNLAQGYIDFLKTLSPDQRERFLYGRFQNIDGIVFKEFNPEKHILNKEPEELIKECDTLHIGIDLITYAVNLVGRAGNKFIVIDEIRGQRGDIAGIVHKRIIKRWAEKYKIDSTFIDHNLGKAGVKEFPDLKTRLATKGAGSLEKGVDKMKNLFYQDLLFINGCCTSLLDELEEYHYNEYDEIVKEDDHYIDDVRYVINTLTAHPKTVAEGF